MNYKRNAESCQTPEDPLRSREASLVSPQGFAANEKGQGFWRFSLSTCPCCDPRAVAAEEIQGTFDNQRESSQRVSGEERWP